MWQSMLKSGQKNVIKHLYSKPQKQFQTFKNDNVPNPPRTQMYLCKAKVIKNIQSKAENIHVFRILCNLLML